MSDDNAFLKEMADVKPISQDRVIIPSRVKLKDNYLHKRFIAENHGIDENPLSNSTIKFVGPDDVVAYKSAGIQNNVFRSLRLGKYEADSKLDLHNYTVAEARQAVHDFLQQSMKYHLRCLLILHGKGGRENHKHAIIKSHVVQWLENNPNILAFHSTPSHQGGTGALYALLKQSEEAKQLNRERFDLRK